MELWRDEVAPLLVFTGGKEEGDRFTEGGSGARWATRRGVPTAAVLTECSRTTYQNLAGAKQLLERRDPGAGRHRIVVVSDPFHMFRAVKQAADLGLEAYPSPTRTSPLSASRLKLTELVVREDLAIAGYLLSGPASEEVPVALTVVDHPLAGTLLTALRDQSTPPPLFRLLAKRLSLVLAMEATRGSPRRPGR